jgi:Asp-tRNA(Asn)/Glu-tRNA(Gln) amidotransferase A subunit family amidase
MLKTTDSLDTPGFFVRAPTDLEPTLDSLRVHGLDYPIVHSALCDRERQNKPAGRPWRVAFVRPHSWSYAHSYAKVALARELAAWQNAGIEVVERSLPSTTTEAHAIHETIYDKTLAYYFKAEFSRAQLISPVFKRMVEHGMTISREQYEEALDRQRAMAREVDAQFSDVDAFVTLSVAGEAVLRTEPEPPDSCLLWTLCMLPVVNIPSMTGPHGLPIGAQLVARRYNDLRLFRLVAHLAALGLAPGSSSPYRKAIECNQDIPVMGGS